MNSKHTLPRNPDYQSVCALIDDKENEDFWTDIAQSITSEHGLASKTWARVYVIMSWLPGISLSEVWADMAFSNRDLLVAQVGEFARLLHENNIDVERLESSVIRKDWENYHKELLDSGIKRHRANPLPESLVSQIEGYLDNTLEYFDDGIEIFIHMDLHPWNLMVELRDDVYPLSGVLDFGDAIIGRSRLLELATPILFLCQGNRELIKQLFDSYGLYTIQEKTQRDLMAVALIRPDCDFNFVLEQVPITGPRDTWEEIASQLFPV